VWRADQIVIMVLQMKVLHMYYTDMVSATHVG
jgi:hypothetical protein